MGRVVGGTFRGTAPARRRSGPRSRSACASAKNPSQNRWIARTAPAKGEVGRADYAGTHHVHAHTGEVRDRTRAVEPVERVLSRLRSPEPDPAYVHPLECARPCPRAPPTSAARPTGYASNTATSPTTRRPGCRSRAPTVFRPGSAGRSPTNPVPHVLRPRVAHEPVVGEWVALLRTSRRSGNSSARAGCRRSRRRPPCRSSPPTRRPPARTRPGTAYGSRRRACSPTRRTAPR